MGLLSSAYAEDFEKDEMIKTQIQKELDSFYHLNFKAILCPVDDAGSTAIPSIPYIPYKFGGGYHHRKPKCDGAKEFGKFHIFVKGFFNLRFSYKLKLKINGTVNAAHIHCKVDDGDRPVAATLDIYNLKGIIKLPDNGNACGYESFQDLYLALKMGKAYVVIHTNEKPSGHLKGDISSK